MSRTGSNNPSWKHGHNMRGRRTPEYEAWASMLGRCRSPGRADYVDYGGRGITVCERWEVFENFLADVGPRPSPTHSLDRRDLHGNYESSNVRWATPEEQARNRRNTRLTADLVREIRRRVAAGEQQKAVAKSIGVSLPAVNHVMRGRTWKDVA